MRVNLQGLAAESDGGVLSPGQAEAGSHIGENLGRENTARTAPCRPLSTGTRLPQAISDVRRLRSQVRGELEESDRAVGFARVLEEQPEIVHGLSELGSKANRAQKAVHSVRDSAQSP